MTNFYLLFGKDPMVTSHFLDIELGKNSLCHLVTVHDEYVSNNHMIAYLKSDRTIWIADMGSTNGTWIIDQLIGFRSSLVRVSMTGRFTQLLPYQSVKIGRTIIPHGSPTCLDMLL